MRCVVKIYFTPLHKYQTKFSKNLNKLSNFKLSAHGFNIIEK